MGQGQIISEYGDGVYRVKIIYGGRDRINVRINTLTVAIAELQTRIDNENDGYQKTLLKLEQSALEKSKQYLENNFPDDYETDIHCADYSEGLTGDVGTVEVPGEDQFFNLQPGHELNAVYNQSRDGSLWPSIAGSGSWSYFNQCLLPAWQKWKPTFRYAQILEISKLSDTCRIEILPFQSSQQSLNINQGEKYFGSGTTSYLYTNRSYPGWDDFKSNNPSHPLSTNTQEPETLPSTDELIAQIWAINDEVNSKHLYATDASYRKAADLWAIMAGDDDNPLFNDRGDCEDFALTKADKLINDLGLSASNMQVGICYTRGGDLHANLLVPTTNHGTLVLDIGLIGRPTKSKLDAIGWYAWDLFLTKGGSTDEQWADYSVEVFDVAIEYMDCNAAAFNVGDAVLVKFENQDWSQPKVVGFKENPQDCGVFFYQMFGKVGQPWKTNMVDKTWSSFQKPTVDPDRYDVGCVSLGSGILCVGGWYPTGSTTSELFNNVDLLSGESYVAKTDIPGAARARISTFEISGKAYAVGGWKYWPGTFRVKENYEYDPVGNSWAAKIDPPNEVAACSGHNIDNKGYVFGSVKWIQTICNDPASNWYDPENFVGEYDPVGDSWATKGSVFDEQYSRIQFSNETHAFIVGSACRYDHPNVINPLTDCDPIIHDRGVTNALNRYDPATDTWSIRGSISDFSSPSHYPGTFYPFTATAAQPARGSADGFESNGYIHTREINGTGLIKWDTTAETWSLFSDQEPYEPTGKPEYMTGCVN